MAGFIEGVELVKRIVQKHLTLAAVIEIAKRPDWNSHIFHRIEDEVALEVANRVEDAGDSVLR